MGKEQLMRVTLLIFIICIVLTPFLYFVFIHKPACIKAQRLSNRKPEFFSDRFYKIMLYELIATLIFCVFLYISFLAEKKTKHYMPAHLRNGVIEKTH